MHKFLFILTWVLLFALAVCGVLALWSNDSKLFKKILNYAVTMIVVQAILKLYEVVVELLS